MTAGDRRRMRAAIASGLDRGEFPAATAEHPGVLPEAAGASLGHDAVARFTRELLAVGGMVHDASDAAGVAAVVLERLRSGLARLVLGWDETELPVAGVYDHLRMAGVAVLREPHGPLSPSDKRRLARASIGITGVTAAIVDTGSIVLVTGPGRGRLPSLLPGVHIAIVSRTQLVPSLPWLLAARPELVEVGSNMVCITGPSRTADIEHTLSRGVHGPGDVHVVLI